MVKASSTIKMNWGNIKALTQASVKALEETAEYVHTEIVQAQVMPYDTGTLQGEGGTFVDTSKSSSGTVSIVSSTPYARRLYFHPEYNFQKTENPNAGGEWFKDWLPGGEKEKSAQETFARLYKRIAGT